ncbi:MAG: SWI/SNF complex component snf12 [Bathelium mastoideum]|nr:MAG: SWI/SNF complex component snf12 [Bathelium mastoideum]
MIKWTDLDTTFRRAGPMVPPPHAPSSLTPAQLQQQQAAEAHRRELGKRQAKKPTDKNLPDGLDAITIGDGVERYKALREVERRLDAVMMRKRLDIQDSVNRNVQKQRTLRIWVSNTVENQPWQQTGMSADAFDFQAENAATYKVKIEGRLLPDEEDEGDQDANKENEADKDGDAMDHDGEDGANKPKRPPAAAQRTKLSHFFKSIKIEFDQYADLQQGQEPIEWTKPKQDSRQSVPSTSSNEVNFDCLEFERSSDENINITIHLVRDESPERFKLDKALADILDTDEEDRAGAVMGIWEYVKARGLQEDEENRMVHCDERLKQVFGKDTVFFPHIPGEIFPHLSALPPIRIPYTIRVDRAHHEQHPVEPTIYDLRVPVPSPLRAAALALTQSPTHLHALQRIAQLDDQLATTVQALATEKAKHGFLASMARDPVRFVRRWVSSQRRDLEVLMGEATRGAGAGEDGSAEEFRRGGREGVWGGELARESVALWSSRRRASPSRRAAG